MEKVKKLILGIIGLLVVIGTICLAVAVGIFALLIAVSVLVIGFGAAAIPATIKTFKNRKNRKKEFKIKCKGKGIKPDMKLYRDYQKEKISFGTETVLNAALNLSNLSIEKNQQDYIGMHNEINKYIIEEQLHLQEELQRTIYGLEKDDKEIYFKTLEELKNETNIKIPGVVTSDLGLYELYYLGDFEGRSKVIKRESIMNPKKRLLLTRNGDINEGFNQYTNEWQECETITNLEQVYSMLAEKGIDELAKGIKTRGQR